MSKFVDLTGCAFGELTAKERCGTRHGKALWRCLCACGEETFVKSNLLRSGHTKSCGHLRPQAIDIAGVVFGRLTAIEKVSWGVRGAHWFCRCECGNNTIVPQADLRAKFGGVKSCGCLSGSPRVLTGYESLTGQRFGYLSVLAEDESGSAGRRWVCSCCCGRTKSVSERDLREGRVTSCGCKDAMLRTKPVPVRGGASRALPWGATA